MGKFPLGVARALGMERSVGPVASASAMRDIVPQSLSHALFVAARRCSRVGNGAL